MAKTLEPQLLTRAEVAQKLKVSVRTLERWEEGGDLVPIRLGRNVRYRVADVDDYVRKATES